VPWCGSPREYARLTDLPLARAPAGDILPRVSEILPDVIAPGLRILFCGVNPGASSAAAGHSFANPSTRFWRTLYGAGLTPRLLTAQEDQSLVTFGLGLTAAAPRPSRRAADVSRAESRAGVARLRWKVETYAPRALAFLGKPAFAAITGQAAVGWGRQAERFARAEVWVLPNPSGLNRRFSLDQLVEAYAALGDAVTDGVATC
jgi:TDG/mug DNA glycosylase family protein